MANQKISALPTITGAGMADGDKFVLVDESADSTVATTRSEFFKDTPPINVSGSLGVTGTVNVGTGVIASGALPITTGADLTLDAVGDITLDADGGDIRFKDGGTEVGAIVMDDGNNTLIVQATQNDADIKFTGKDNNSGITALTLDMSDAGTATFNHDIKLPDNGKAIFGAGSDLQIYHDGSNSFISDQGTGQLVLLGSNAIALNNSANNENMLVANENGSVDLYHNNVKKLATTSAGVAMTGNLTLGDNNKAIFGTGSDLQIYHASGNSYIQDVGDGQLRLDTNGTDVRITKTDSEYMAKFIVDGAVELYHNNVKKIETTSAGVTVTGSIVTSGNVGIVGDLNIGNNDPSNPLSKLRFGATQFGAADIRTFSVGHKVGLDFYTDRTGDNTINPTFAMRIDEAGDVLVGKTSGNNTVQGTTLYNNGQIYATASGQQVMLLTRKTNNGEIILFYREGTNVGNISVTGSSTSYNTSSDYRLKTDAQPITGASARVQALNPVNFEWISDGTRVDGFLAHEAQAVIPECVTGERDGMKDEEYEVTPAVYEDVVVEAVEAVEATYDQEGLLLTEGTEGTPERTEQRLVSEAVMSTRSIPEYQSIDQSKIVPLLTAALREALNKIDAMEERISALEG